MLTSKFPTVLSVKAEVTQLVQLHIMELCCTPEALPYLVIPKEVDENSTLLQQLPHWAACSTTQAREFFTPASGEQYDPELGKDAASTENNSFQTLSSVVRQRIVDPFGAMSVFQAFLKTAEDMSKEDIAANRAIGLYGVSFLQIHIKDSKSLRSLTHYNTRSLVTTAKFHLIHYNLLAYRISRGSIQLIDLRQSAVYDHKAEVLMGATALKGGAGVSSMGSPFKEKFDLKKLWLSD
ncbi:Phosphatidylinositol 4-kinase alpha 1 [Vitis vinifera]|uniref:Phosphatidylinositol 4-kinase alpha 1 n=1 Tax=Vitis vinifera TaxID=29760 RepID=A0A438HUP8_VITVI|nr:Phosphatidylinositol 4-kinase alpha 1 [Vitis vinifera]